MVGSTSTSTVGGGGGVAGTKKKGEKKGHRGRARSEAEETGGARDRGLRREGNRRKRRGGRGKGRRPSDEFSGTRPLWRGGVAAQTLEKKNRRGPRG